MGRDVQKEASLDMVLISNSKGGGEIVASRFLTRTDLVLPPL
jgi:hypothetical protein